MRRRNTVWIILIALVAAGWIALEAPAVSPPPNLDQAIVSQRALAAESPGDARILNDLGNLLLLADDMEAAEAAYRDALGIDPALTSARYNLALLLAQTERPKAALDELERVLEREPNNAWAHYQVGAILDARGAERRAIQQYATAFRLDPQLAFAEINPHVIENEHVTEAMLNAYRDLPLAAQAPKTYERPSQIVDLLVPAPTASGAQGDAMARGAGDAAESRTQASWASGAAGVAADEGGAGGERVLREDDLERGGTVNQVVVPGYSQPRGGTRVPPARSYAPPTQTPSNDGRAPGALPTQPGGRQRFVPGIPSTGRLEIELFPVDDAGDDAATLAAAG